MANTAAWDQGWAIGANAAQHGRDRKEMLSDEERRLKADPIIAGTKQIQANLPLLKDQYGVDSPQYKEATQKLTDYQQAFDELYHPIKAPGAIAQDFHWLADKIRGIAQPKTATSSTTQAPATTINTPAAPLQSPELPGALPGEVGTPAATGPGMGSGSSITLPAGPQTTVAKAPPVPWGQAQVLKQQTAARQKAQQESGLLAAGVGLSPQEEAMSQYHTQEAVRQAQIDDTLKLADRLGLSETARDELKQQLTGLKNVTPKPLTGAAGQPYKGPDGLWRQAVSNPDGTVGFREMPADWKPNTKAIAGTIINTKKYGWIKTWVDPYNPTKVVGYQKITPGRQYAGTTSTSTSTDPAGLTTSTSRSTMPTTSAPVDMDFSGMQELPENFTGDLEEVSPAASGKTSDSVSSPSGSPNKSASPSPTPPKSVATPKVGAGSSTSKTPADLKKQVPAPPKNSEAPLPLDASGHIPLNAPYNHLLIQAANQLLDGEDITKLPIPAKDKEAASEVASKYGWGGQGLFTPREALQLKEGATFLKLMADSPTLKVLDNGFFANIPMIGSSSDPSKEGFFGKLTTNLASRGQTPEQQKFMDLYRQLDAMAIGLRALVQTGRGTQKQTDLLISELPNPYNTPNSADAKRRLQFVQKELDIAAKTGKLPPVEQMQSDLNSQLTPGQLTSDQLMDLYLKHKQSTAPKK